MRRVIFLKAMCPSALFYQVSAELFSRYLFSSLSRRIRSGQEAAFVSLLRTFSNDFADSFSTRSPVVQNVLFDRI